MTTESNAGWLNRLARLWRDTRALFGVLGLVRFQLILLLIGIVLVLFVGQGRDLIVYYGLKCQASVGREVILFLATAMGCALTMWYSARVMFRFRFELPSPDADKHQPATSADQASSDSREPPSDQNVFPWLKHHLPRWLGAGVFLALLAGLLVQYDKGRFEPNLLIILLCVSLVVFVAFVNLRRRLFGLPLYRQQKTSNNLSGWDELPPSTRRWYWVLLAANVLVIIAAVRAPHLMAALIGAGGVLLLGAGLAVVVGSTLVYFSNWYRIPVISLALIGIAGFSLFNENHRVRLCPDMASTDSPDFCLQPADERVDAKAALHTWISARAKTHRGGRLPVIIVATEGGGIRAAYWTAAVMGTLEDRWSDETAFHRYVLGLSGVSGGSLGASVFVAHAADGGRGAARTLGQNMLQNDFLGPTLVTLMFPDLLQRFLPLPLFDDRATTLEQSFERGWRDAASPGSDRFAQPLLSLYDDPWTPWLMLNSTLVESGERMVYAPIRMTDGLAGVDGVSMMGTGVPLSTAVHNSARFPYVSPAGVVRRRDNAAGDQREHWTRLVDGGYVDNAGAQTALELLRLVQRERANLLREFDVRVEPYVIQITNSEASPMSPCRRTRTDDDAQMTDRTCNKRRLLPETLSPLISMLNTRPGNTEAAMARLRAAAGPGRYTRFALRDNGVAHPLGWMLAPPSRVDMLHQIDGYPTDSGQVTVRAEIGQVLSFLQDTLNAPSARGKDDSNPALR